MKTSMVVEISPASLLARPGASAACQYPMRHRPLRMSATSHQNSCPYRWLHGNDPGWHVRSGGAAQPPSAATSAHGAFWRRRRRLLTWVASLAVISLLYVAYLGQSRSAGTDADGAGNVLQAWDMLHGNLLLRGWWLSDVSFYTTELPEYMLVELARGLNPAVINLAGAATYTLLLVLAALLAKGRATGTAALQRVLIAAGIMLAPGPGFSAARLLSAPDHTGTAVPLLLTWLAIDRLGDRRYLPWLAGALLTWDEIADQMAIYVGALPVIAISAIRIWRRRGSRRTDAGLLAGAAVSIPLALGRHAAHPAGRRLCRRTRPRGPDAGRAATAPGLADAPLRADAVRRGLHRAAFLASHRGRPPASGRRHRCGVGLLYRGQAASGRRSAGPAASGGRRVNLAASCSARSPSISARRMSSPPCSPSARRWPAPAARQAGDQGARSRAARRGGGLRRALAYKPPGPRDRRRPRPSPPG